MKLFAKDDPLALLLDDVAKSRNALVHPKAREVHGDPASHDRTSIKIPEIAQQSVNNMEKFFEQFAIAVPAAAHLVVTTSGNTRK